MSASYMDAISNYFPTRRVSAGGDGFDYDLLRAEDGMPLPPKNQLDTLRLALAQERKWREIQAVRDFRRMNGVKVGTHWFHSDDTSRIQHIGLLLMGAGMPQNIMWKTLTNDFVLMTPQLAQQIFMSVGALDMQIFAVAEGHKRSMMQSANPTTYDFSGGWPQTFGE